jgi:serine/threonine-protein kinase
MRIGFMAKHTYQLVSRVEAGEVSDLFSGMQDRNRKVTLKVFSPRASDPEYGKALASAARQVGSLGHPSILHFEDIGVANDRLCAVRALIDGHHLGVGLSRLATKEVVLPPMVGLQIMLEVMDAVGAAHQAGITHGALTPANILLGKDGKVWVTDFMALWAMQQSITMKPLATRGRQVYRASEVQKGHEPEAGSDVYSVGAILYEVLTLHEAASGRVGGNVSTRRDGLMPPSRLDRRINARLDPLVMRALDPLKSRRHKNCSEMAESFRSFLSSQGAMPGRTEIAKFVAEMFPNEVSVSGIGGELPWSGDFNLSPVDTGRSLPGLAVEVRDRPSYSMPSIALDQEPTLSDTNVEDMLGLVAAVNRGDTEEASASARVTEPVPHKKLLEQVVTESGPPPTSAPSPAPAPAPAAKTKAPEMSWEAPPGQLDPAVARKLNEVAANQPVAPAPAAPAPVSDAGATVQTPAVPASPAPPLVEKKPKSGWGRPRKNPAPSTDPNEDPKTKLDWHVHVPPPEPPPPPPKTPLSYWLFAGVVGLCVSGVVYMGVQRRLASQIPREIPRPFADHPGPHGEHEQAPEHEHRSQHEHEREHEHSSGSTHADKETSTKGLPAYCLNLTSDAKKPLVFIDNKVIKESTPLHNYQVSAGPHHVKVLDTTRAGPGAEREMTVSEADLKCPGRTIALVFANDTSAGAH